VSERHRAPLPTARPGLRLMAPALATARRRPRADQTPGRPHCRTRSHALGRLTRCSLVVRSLGREVGSCPRKLQVDPQTGRPSLRDAPQPSKEQVQRIRVDRVGHYRVLDRTRTCPSGATTRRHWPWFGAAVRYCPGQEDHLRNRTSGTRSVAPMLSAGILEHSAQVKTKGAADGCPYDR
jgi:hypothetical protein